MCFYGLSKECNSGIKQFTFWYFLTVVILFPVLFCTLFFLTIFFKNYKNTRFVCFTSSFECFWYHFCCLKFKRLWRMWNDFLLGLVEQPRPHGSDPRPPYCRRTF